MSYQAIARKYRPETFDQVVGQVHVTGTLRAAMRKDKLSHAYLFSGPRGCGKTTVARLLAKAINCQTNREGDPCGTCDTCTGIARGNYLDVLEIDAASNTGVDNIRDLRDMAQYSPSEGSSRVFIIDEVHMLSKGAFNALLKILEEPPARVFFFFATTEPNKIPRTILSRCQRFDFRLLTRDELADHMKRIAEAEGVDLNDGGLRLLVSLAEGSVRDGLSLLDQVIAGSDGKINEDTVVAAFGLVRSELFMELNEAIVGRDPARALRLVEDLSASGQSLDAFARGVVTNFRNLMLLKVDPDLAPMVDLPPDQLEVLQQQASTFSEQDLLTLIDRAGQHFERIHRSTQPRILLEASLVEYCRFESRVLLSDLARRLEGVAGGAPMGRPSGPAGSGAGATGAGGSGPRPAGGGGRTEARAAARVVPEKPMAPLVSNTPASEQVAEADKQVPGWTQLINDLMQKAPRIAACLMEGLPSLDQDGVSMTVCFTDDKAFQVKSLRSDLARIETAASERWQKAIKITLVQGQTGQAVETKEEIRREVAPTAREELDAARNQDQSLNDLVDLMDADPLPETDRDKWKPSGK